MSNFFKCNVFSVVAVGSCLGGLSLLGGCGGGGSGAGTPSGTPSPFDGTYSAAVTPTGTLASDAQAPTATLSVLNGRATSQFNFFLQPSVVSAVQQAINTGLTDAGFASAIPDNQAPANIQFSGNGQLDGNGRLMLTSIRDVSVCGRATLTLDSTLSSAAGATGGQGTYNITFPDNLTIRISGRNISVGGTCNNLPLRAGTVVFTR